jgi:TolB-like protein
VQWALAYLAGAFVVFQAIEVLAEPWGISPALQRAVHVVLVVGLFISLVLAWYHGESGHQHLNPIEILLIVAILIGGGAMVWATQGADRFSESTIPVLDARNLAVLYFEDLSPDGGLRHVADGITEGLIRELSRVNELDVVSGNGVAQFRDDPTSAAEIAELLETGTLIQGSLEPAGEMLRISVRLVEGTSGVDFDRRQFEVPSNELLLARDSTVSEVAWLLRERLGEEVRLRRRQAETSSVEAWALVQRGEAERTAAEHLVTVGDPEGVFAALARADSFFALASEMDPQWVSPPTLRGWVAYRESRLASDLDAALEGIKRSLAHAETALALDPNAASALELRGTTRYWHHILGVTTDPQEEEALLLYAQEDLETAVDMEPSLASAHNTLSHLYYRRGEITRATLAAQLAYEADAYLEHADAILWRLFTTTFDTERFAQARGWCEEGRRRFSGHYRFSQCKLLELTIPTVTPDVDAAWRFRQETVDAAPEPQKPLEEHKTLMWVGEVLARAGLPDSARSVLVEARAGADVDPDQELVYLEARARTVLGDYDEAIDLLRQLLIGYSFEDEAEAEEWANHWYWRDLRGHPDFEWLVRVSR